MSTVDSTVKIHLDKSNSILVQEVQTQILLAVQATITEMLQVCQIDEKFATMGIDYHHLQWSSNDVPTELGLAMLPGLMVVLHNLLAMALTADQLVTELELGLLQRQLASNVSMSLSILSQFVFHFTLVIPQAILSVILLKLLYLDYQTNFAGILLVFFLLLCQSICGMSMGLFITSFFSARDQVIQVSLYVKIDFQK